MHCVQLLRWGEVCPFGDAVESMYVVSAHSDLSRKWADSRESKRTIKTNQVSLQHHIISSSTDAIGSYPRHGRWTDPFAVLAWVPLRRNVRGWRGGVGDFSWAGKWGRRLASSVDVPNAADAIERHSSPLVIEAHLKKSVKEIRFFSPMILATNFLVD